MDQMLRTFSRSKGEDDVFEYRADGGVTLTTFKTTCDIQIVEDSRTARLLADLFKALEDVGVSREEIKGLIYPLVDAFQDD